MQETGQAPANLGIDNWQCSANMSAYLSNRRALAQAAEFFYDIKPSKAMRSWMKGKYWEDAIAAGKAQELLDYAKEDAHLCAKLWIDHSDKWPQWERDVARVTIDSGKKGVRVNTELLYGYIEACSQSIFECQKAIPWVADGEKPTSPKAMALECRKVGIECAPVKDDDEEGYDEWERKYAPLYPWIGAVASLRSMTKVAKTLETMKLRLRDDDSIESSLKYFAAHTGRWGGEGGINFQNFRKEPLDCCGTPVDVRRLFIPRPGKKMIVCDLSQIEPRVLAWVTGNQPLLALLAGGMSPYEAFARTAMGWTGGDLKEAGKTDPAAKDLYQLAKIQILGLGYGCGWKKFITIAAGYGVTLDEARSRELVDAFRSGNPLIAGEDGIWNTLGGAFKRSRKDGVFEVGLPSGRKLTYRNVKDEVRLRTNQATGKVENEWVTTAEVLRKDRIQRVSLYGGLLTENLIQAIARDIFATHILELNKQGLPPLFTVHDEAVLEVEPDVTPRDIEIIMSKTPEWIPGCPVGAEAVEVPYYQK
jgi:hypothetical protein